MTGWIGDVRPMTWTCGFQESPAAPFCDAEAVVHGVVASDDLTELKYQTMACARHKAAIEAVSRLVHDIGSACGLPGAMVEWDHGVSWCHLPWDTDSLAAEPARAVAR